MDFKEEYQWIGGIEQYLLHYPAKNAPVLLFVHGGPGSATSNFGYLFREWWGELFQIVLWDQRGSGKTLHKNPDVSKYPLNVDVMLSDLAEVVEYLRIKYNQEKIVILGHSWGTFLATQYLQTHADKVSLYISVGQVVNFIKNEELGLLKALELASKSGDVKSIKKLNELGDFPPETLDQEGFQKLITLRTVEQKYGLAVGANIQLVKEFVGSPVFKISDLITMLFKVSKVNLPLCIELAQSKFEMTIQEISVPVCSIQGENDYQTTTSLAHSFFENIKTPALQMHVIQGAGHNTMNDQPELFAEALRKAKTMI